MKKIVIPLIVIVTLLVLGYFVVVFLQQRQQAQALGNYMTETVSRGTLTSLIGATGTVRANQQANLAWEASGNAGAPVVQEGDRVDAGQVLVSLDADNLPASILAARADLLNAQKQLDDLQDSSQATVQAAQAVSNTQKALIEAQKLYDEEYDAEDYQDEIDRANEEVLDAEEELEDAQDDFEPYKDRDPDNQTRKSYEDKLEAAQEKYDEAVRKYDLLVLEKAIARQSVEAAQAQLADAERTYARIKDGPDPDDVAALQARIDAAQATLDSADLAAPFSGTITYANVQRGDPVTPGQVAFRLDDLSKLFVDVNISEVDINNVAVGQAVRLSFDAIQDKDYTGRVSEVSMVGVPTQGVVEFLVTIEVLDADADVKPGMTAAVNVVIETLENVLIVPNRAVRSIDGNYVVYVVEGNELVMVTVELGANSDTHSEVVGGDLRSGDSLVLNPPLTFDTNGPPSFARRR
ncbi:MAG: efflux RND transporter periplasmic adaptor subunit [Chloroflexota bacterium]